MRKQKQRFVNHLKFAITTDHPLLYLRMLNDNHARKSWAEADKMFGYQPDIVIIDEFEDFSKEAFDSVMSRAARPQIIPLKNRPVFGDTTA